MSALGRACLALLVVLPLAARGGNPVQVAVDPGAGRAPISPYIYGTNQDLPGVATPGARRMGGNRMTGYNWETNASNAGTDYLNESDNYLVYTLPAAQQSVPAVALTAFHDQSLAAGTPYSVLTLQMGGYVAADEAGPVTASQAAPSSRWKAVQNDKPGGVFANPPDLTDGNVYMDELLNVIVSRYGPASGKTGVKGYNLDNEPSLWPSTHPYLHPAATTCAELVSKSAALAKTVKRMDPSAEVLGGVLYGSEAYFTFQNAPDWPAIQSATGYRWFIDYFLDQMGQASTTAGRRLLDVLDLHRYSDENVGGSGGVSITNQTDFSDTATNMQRVQAPRVLWDTTYKENSWVQLYFPQFLPYIPNLQASIAARYPGTKLAFTEYSYGGESDISGGIAQADVLGIYGKYGVYLGCVWLLHGTPAPLYTAAAFNLFLNYDGQGGAFGPTSVSATNSDVVNASAYASVDASGVLHVVVLNKSFTQPADVSFTIAGPASYGSARVFAFDASSSRVTERAAAPVSGNTLLYSLPALTAAHFVFAPAGAVPQFTAGPQSQTVAAGSPVTFTASATGGSAVAYRWYLNGAAVSDGGGVTGSSTSTLTIAAASAANAGTYTCVATDASGSATSAPATLTVAAVPAGRLINLSCRASVGSGSNILIAGFAVGGAGTSGQALLLLRASGPALAPFGVTGTLPDPQLQVFSGGTATASNQGWAGSTSVAAAATATGAFAWTNTSSHDAALVANLAAGPYTAQVSGQSGDTGIALVEVYDASVPATRPPSAPRLVNLSARVQVGAGAGTLIAGFVVGGSAPVKVLVRASGPALTAFGVSGTLPDPKLSLFQGTSGAASPLGSNAGWAGDAQVAAAAAQVGAFAWTNASSADSALLVTLAPGTYTAQVTGASGDTGVALVEVYEVP